MKWSINKTAILPAVLAIAALLYYLVLEHQRVTIPEGLVSGNGRIEATEIDIATPLTGRVKEIWVNEGDFVSVGQVLAEMQVDVLLAQRDEARAQNQKSIHAVQSAQAHLVMSERNQMAIEALIAQRESELDSAERRGRRIESLARSGASTDQDLDDARASVRIAQAAVAAVKAQNAAALAAIEAARAQWVGAQSGVAASEAALARIQADLSDSQLKAPRSGRVQYRIAQPGEVLGVGGKVLNLVDLSDVYMTFFLPETVVGKVGMGTEVRIVLDAAPTHIIPAQISFVASTAQFTPKTVETASERQKLMFRVKAQIDRELLRRNLSQVKTGLPGVAWIKMNPTLKWPSHLELGPAP